MADERGHVGHDAPALEAPEELGVALEVPLDAGA
jgi:hypothetical protein